MKLYDVIHIVHKLTNIKYATLNKGSQAYIRLSDCSLTRMKTRSHWLTPLTLVAQCIMDVVVN